MNDKETLREPLNRPSVPSDLEQKIRSNWQNQLDQSQQAFHWLPHFGIAASIALLMLTLNFVWQAPAVVNAAYDDIISDAKLGIGMSIPMADIVKTHDIHLTDLPSNVVMTKKCRLHGHNTTHMQLTAADRSDVHLFIYQGELPKQFWQQSTGEISNMPWKIIKPREDLSVLVLQTPGGNTAEVESMIQHMFVG